MGYFILWIAGIAFFLAVKNQNHNLNELPYEGGAEGSVLDGLDSQSKAEVTKIKTPTSRGRVIPLRLRCRRCGERFTTKSDYQVHLQSQVGKLKGFFPYLCVENELRNEVLVNN